MGSTDSHPARPPVTRWARSRGVSRSGCQRTVGWGWPHHLPEERRPPIVARASRPRDGGPGGCTLSVSVPDGGGRIRVGFEPSPFPSPSPSPLRCKAIDRHKGEGVGDGEGEDRRIGSGSAISAGGTPAPTMGARGEEGTCSSKHPCLRFRLRKRVWSSATVNALDRSLDVLF